MKRNASRIVALLALLCLVLSLCACGGGQSAGGEDAVSKYGSDTLKLYLPGEYLGENLISDFEKEFGVRVIVENFDSNEMMYTKLQAGDAYDVLIPSDYMIERLINQDMLQQLDLSLVPNLSNLADQVLSGS